jgi:capsular exopolysaccharide synthesis family protein
MRDVIHRTSLPGLDILLAGNRAPNPAELLGSNSMKQLLTDALTQYDFILLDSAPILPVADGLLLSRLVDGVLLVVRSRITERKVAKEARRRLLRAGSRILGVVLNDLNTKTADNFDLATYGDYIESVAQGGQA